MISFTIRWWQIHVFMPMLTVFHFKVSGETPGSCIQHWMISLEGHIISEGIQPAFVSGLAAVFSTFYNFNLQYQAEAACTLEFIQR